MSKDEKALLNAFSNSKEEFPSLREIGAMLGMDEKRINYIAYKWGDKDYWDWGVCVDLGWLTDKGKAWATELGIKR